MSLDSQRSNKLDGSHLWASGHLSTASEWIKLILAILAPQHVLSQLGIRLSTQNGGKSANINLYPKKVKLIETYWKFDNLEDWENCGKRKKHIRIIT